MSDAHGSAKVPGAEGLSGRSVDAAQFADLVRPHMTAMSRLATRLGPRDAQDDIVQEALVRAWRSRGSYDSRRGPLVNWLLTIVANESRRAWRVGQLPVRIERPAPAAASADDQLDLENAVRRLPARQKLAVDCFYFAGLSVVQTGAVMGCSEGTVKSTLADARANLRKVIGPWIDC
jgi:RNA polymerase sigma factor (sigma-70 family)